MHWIAALLVVAATATTPPDFSHDGNLRVLAPGGQMYETSVAVSGNNIVIAVINHDGGHPVDLFVSPNRGFTWSAPIEMPKTIDGKAHRYGTDPTLAVLDDGSFALGYLVIENTPSTQTLTLGDERLVVLRSSDGVTWSAPVTLASGNSGINPYIDRPWLSVDRVRGTVYATWSRTEGSGGEDVVLQTSTDRGATWSAPAAVTPKREELAQIAALSNGTLVEANYDGDGQAFVSRYSSTGGAFWSGPVVIGYAGNAFISPGTKTQSPPLAVLASYRDELYAVLPTAASISFTRSRDGGKSWSAPLQLGGVHGDAVLPSLAVDDASGTIFVSWMDGRDDATNATLRLYGTRSTDGGATFEAPRPFSPPFTAGGRIADTEGMVSLGDGTALKAFSPAGGYLTAARLFFVTHRRAVNH
jgi:hypothetical protein